jgi:hypothetical protein
MEERSGSFTKYCLNGSTVDYREVSAITSRNQGVEDASRREGGQDEER